MDHARVVIAAWRMDHHEYRTHSLLVKLSPSEFVALCREIKGLPKKAINGIKLWAELKTQWHYYWGQVIIINIYI